jgi:hypothetical protein
MTVVCHGLTTRFTPCKNKVRNGCFCHLHKHQKIEFYVNPDDTWPRPLEVSTGVFKYDNVENLLGVIQGRVYGIITEYTVGDSYQNRKLRLFTLELIKHNIECCIHSKRIQGLITRIIKDLEEFDFLGDYLFDFKKKCVKNFRHSYQKKLVWFYMKHAEGLNLDVVEHIMSFY